MKVDAEQTKKMVVQSNKKIKKIEKFLLPFCEWKLLIRRGEILKWAVKKRGEENGEGLHFFDLAVQSTILVSLVL